MPSSYHEQIPIIIDILLRIKPASLLDVGVGFGKYGFLAREYLEIWDNDKGYGSFKIRIDGVEPFARYITPCHEYIYNNIYNMDILEFVKEQKMGYDLVLLIDVLEHIDKDEGKKLLQILLRKNRNILISTPKVFNKQGEVFGNKYEVHRSFWKKKELLSFKSGIVIPFKWSHIVFLGRDYKKLKRYRLKRHLIKFFPGLIQ